MINRGQISYKMNKLQIPNNKKKTRKNLRFAKKFNKQQENPVKISQQIGKKKVNFDHNCIMRGYIYI